MQGMSPNLASFLRNMQAQFMSLQQRTNELESLAATNARLTAQLVNAEKLIADLRSQLASQGNCQITTNASTSSAPTTPKEPGTEASTWATAAAAAHNSVVVPTALSVRKTLRPPSVRRVAASARMFAIPTGPKGYQYVYIPRSRRLTHREVRNSLKTLGVDTGRILDINFPAKDVVGILVYNQYAEKFQTTLTTVAIEILDTFDPLDPKNIADPKYKSLCDSELEEVAAELHSDRCLKALKYLRPHVAVPVGHCFCDQGWISKEDIPVHSVSGPGAGLWNANGLQPRAIYDVLQYCHSLHMLFITETWLLPPSRLPTSWSQIHLYGLPVAGNYRGSMGVSVLISPSCPYPVTQIPMSSNYALAIKIGSLRIVCLYLPLSMSNHDALAVLSSIPLTNDTIICGDFNSRLGSLTGDYATNTLGLALCQWLEERALTVVNGQLSPCIPTFISFCQNVEISSIIDLFITNMSLTNATLNIHTDLSLNSDHRLLSLSFTYAINPTSHAPPPSRKTWNLSRLQEPDVLKLYAHTFVTNSTNLKSTLQSTFEHPPSSRPPIDALTDEFNSLIYNSLSSSIGNRPPRPSHWKKVWNSVLQAAAEHRNFCYKKWHCACGIDRIHWWDKHLKAQAEFRHQVQSSKRQSWHAFCKSMEQDFSKAISKIKQLKRQRQPQHMFQHSDGPATAATIMCEHLASVYSGSILPDQRPPPPLHSTSLSFASASSPFVSSVVEGCMQFMPNCKAPGPDHIRAEMLKVIRPQIAPLLSLLFTICTFGPSVVTHRRSGALAAMATLTAVGACRSGFSLLLSSHLFKTFIQPKFEYGLAITCLLQKDVLLLEKIQDKCLQMIVGGHATSSTAVLKHICNLPTSTLSTLHSNPLFASIPPDLNCSSHIKLSKHFESFRQEKFAHFRLTNTKILIQACHPLLEVDPVLFLPATRIERGSLVRWRMGWLPGKPKECACGFDHTSRRHFQFCITIPSQLFSQLSAPPTDEDNIIDFAISALPISSTHPSPLYWKALLTILWHIDMLCNPNGNYTHETDHGSLWH
ncbi:hypothetical protein PHYBLDRAFT_166906 [Phycomyces blakesleeanus NRRL 1555(-)]|uniref:Endonuclease/exonuclease/phosphatase domain-containing protein n=1 Tax=Phycomyces blakesleeanus (strain ATCC 8743b / DSM 1359 / FGSC 10004 / NBRC 33097 / NRRL 1555) TaxID=763407 RepID=A0A167NCP5_PHYB8|nr:hypothetical protein PHYBLDRAFT_166906 [Phycomyces blakesleeanus NRRL 1555(-)]OAD75680.1 hypothetical protein PHYBLDRAFT_166906 [Phycomyces blakesleeanus NRRL 1555(-)]|eukprot:XP_018293720.1 hypothetical protein PHYBLDRAFT_166906 [Phycomyces blakesleeanus NRRL 1555(-)]